MDKIELIDIYEIDPISTIDDRELDRANLEDFDSSIYSLANSIKKKGLINPITIIKIDDSNYKYRVETGSRRLKAYLLLDAKEKDEDPQSIQFSKIKAIIKEQEDPAKTFHENNFRKAVNPIDEIDSIVKLYPFFHPKYSKEYNDMTHDERYKTGLSLIKNAQKEYIEYTKADKSIEVSKELEYFKNFLEEHIGKYTLNSFFKKFSLVSLPERIRTLIKDYLLYLKTANDIKKIKSKDPILYENILQRIEEESSSQEESQEIFIEMISKIENTSKEDIIRMIDTEMLKVKLFIRDIKTDGSLAKIKEIIKETIEKLQKDISTIS